MKIVTISWVRNEADILEASVRHHAAFADRMIIVDHRSRDNSRSILASLQKEGLPLDVRHDEGFSHRQSAAITSLMREIAEEEDPDWLLPLDADEFVRAESGGVPETLASGPQDKVLRLAWKNYVPLTDDDQAQRSPLRRIIHRRETEAPAWYKMAIPRSILRRGSEYTVSLGSHDMSENSTGTGVPRIESNDLFLAHFPVRSARQISRKILCGWLSALAEPSAIPGSSFQWKALYDEMRQGRFPTDADLTRIALEYATTSQWNRLSPAFTQGPIAKFGAAEIPPSAATVRDPVPCDVDLTYAADDIDPLSVFMDEAEALASEYGKAALSGL